MKKVTDINLIPTPEGTLVKPINALGQRVVQAQLPGCGDFSNLGVPVMVKMPCDLVKSILRGRGARFSSSVAAA